MSSPTSAASPLGRRSTASLRARERLASLGGVRPELAALIVLAGVLNLWALSRNGWANEYYSAAVRSMSSDWHDFLFASLDRSGVMTVDKPPLALWVQALSARLFGYGSLSLLVPQALMGIASVALVYDLVRRRFGRLGGALAGLALAVTPIAVAVSRHNNPDALLVLCCVGALWCTARGLEQGRTRWLVATGVCVGLGFETKMGVALIVVPGIALAWLASAPAGRGRLHALRQLLAGAAALVFVGGAWPALVELTPASQRPWISGTSDNRVLSLIFEYNGLGRVDGQTGGPGGGGPGGGGPGGGGPGGGSLFGGSAGPLRLLNSALGGQVGWLLGFALVGAVAIALQARSRRSRQDAGWLLAVGGAFATSAVLFSFAGGIFHPYYVSLLAPFLAALVGAGAVGLVGFGRATRVLAPTAVLAGMTTVLVVLGDYSGQLTWLVPVAVVVCVGGALALALARERPVRLAALATALAVLLVAPTVWAFETLGHATSGTFPAGGPESLAGAGPGGFGAGRLGAMRGGRSGAGGAASPRFFFGQGGPPGLPGAGAAPGVGAPPAAAGGPLGAGAAPGRTAGEGPRALPNFGPRPGRAGFGGAGFGGAASIAPALRYVRTHGGGTIAVASQSAAASAIVGQDADVAGIGGFSGRESSVGVSWLAQEVRAGLIRWVLAEEGAGGTGGAPGRLAGDTRAGSRRAIEAAAKACPAVSLPSGASRLYDCAGRASRIADSGG